MAYRFYIALLGFLTAALLATTAYLIFTNHPQFALKAFVASIPGIFLCIKEFIAIDARRFVTKLKMETNTDD